MDDSKSEASNEETTIYNNDFQERNESNGEDDADNDDAVAQTSNTRKEFEDWEIVSHDSVNNAYQRKLNRIRKKFKSDTDGLKEEITCKDDIIKENEKELARLKYLENENQQLVVKVEHLGSLEAQYLELQKENEHQKQLIIKYEAEIGKIKDLENEYDRLQRLYTEKRTFEKDFFSLKQQLDEARDKETELQNNLTRASTENKDLRRQIQTVSQRNKTIEEEKEELLHRLQLLHTEVHIYEKDVLILKQQLNEARDKETKLQSNLTRASTENKDLRGQIQTVRHRNKTLEEEKEELLHRLSKLAGAKLTVDNPNIADLSDSKRPTKLAEEFAELYDNEWTDAFEDINIENEQEKTAFMLKILQDANELCVNVSCEHMTRIKESLCKLHMLSSTNDETKTQTSPECDKKKDIIEIEFKSLPSDQIQTVFELKKSIQTRIFTQFQMKATDWIAKTNHVIREEQNNIMKYVEKCVDICWSMSQHVPPVTFNFNAEYSGSLHFNTDMYKPYTKTGKYIDFIIWPALYLHEGGPLLSKGVAQGRG